MADFRRCILALAVIALLTGLVSTASAQPFQCNNSAVPTFMRGEGQTELVGDILAQCSGLNTSGATTAQISVFLGGSVAVTNRLLNSSGLTDALLLVNDPNPAGFCIGTIPNQPGVGTDGCLPNVFQGSVIGNQVFFSNVPISPPGTTAVITYRITNIRANATAIAPALGLSPAQLLANVTITTSLSPFSIPVNNSQLTVGYVQRGLTFGVFPISSGSVSSSASTTPLTFAQCQSTSDKSIPQAVLRFTETFPTAFKVRAVNGLNTNSESGQMIPGLVFTGTTVLSSNQTLGLADFGTRVRAVFANIPNGVDVFVSTTNIKSGVPATASSNIIAQLVSSQNAPFGSFVPATDALGDVGATSNKDVPVFKVTTGEAVWEVTTATNSGIPLDSLDFLVYFSFTANTASNLPQPGVTGTVGGSFAPVSTTPVASSTAPVPRFADTSTGDTAVKLLNISICRTNLLFPFVTATSGFDTGIAIANTSKDGAVFGTATTAQTGTCTLNFFPQTIGTTPAPAPAPLTSAAVAAGDTYVTLVSTVAPLFQGYIIAQCQFQYAHGFAFVQNNAPGLSAMGYLALIIPDNTSRKINAVSLANGSGEVLGQ